jgi:hypothetical protein
MNMPFLLAFTLFHARLMSLIESCRLNEVDVWDYLLTLLSETAKVRNNPRAFLPWNYRRAEIEDAA